MEIKNDHTELIAPCGMNCALCSGYLARHHDIKNKGIRIPYCKGCRPRDKQCAFLKKRCTHLLQHNVHFCYECTTYPCTHLKHLDQRYQTYFRTSLINNLNDIKKNGMEQFLIVQQKKWQCPTCGDTICCHNGLCFHCDIEKLQQKKKRFRWEE